MNLKFMSAFLLLTLMFSVGVVAQSDTGGLKQDTKDAASDTGRAAKKIGRKVKHGTKKTVNKSARATRKGAGKIEDKTTPPR